MSRNQGRVSKLWKKGSSLEVGSSVDMRSARSESNAVSSAGSVFSKHSTYFPRGSARSERKVDQWDLMIRYDKEKFEMEENARRQDKPRKQQLYKQDLDSQIASKEEERKQQRDARERDKLDLLNRLEVSKQQDATDRSKQLSVRNMLKECSEVAQNQLEKRRERARKKMLRERDALASQVAIQNEESKKKTADQRALLVQRASEVREAIVRDVEEKRIRKLKESEDDTARFRDMLSCEDKKQEMRKEAENKRKERYETTIKQMGNSLQEKAKLREKEEDLMFLEAARKKEDESVRRSQRETNERQQQLQNNYKILAQQVAEKRERKLRSDEEARAYASKCRKEDQTAYELEKQKQAATQQRRLDNNRIILQQIRQREGQSIDDRIVPRRAALEIELNSGLLNEMKANPTFSKEANAVLSNLSALRIPMSPL